MSISLALVGVLHHEKEESSPRMPALPALIARLQRQDVTALDEFIAQTRPLAWRLAWSLLEDRHRCEDVLQDVYLTVYQSIGKLRDPGAFRTWFCRIVLNRCKRLLRERRPDSLDEMLEEGVGPYSAGMAERVNNRLEVQEAFDSLIDQDRVVLTLREVFDMAYQEIADSLDIPVGTVRSRLSKARLRLMAALQGPERKDG